MIQSRIIIITKLNKVTTYLFQDFHSVKESKWLRRLLYAFLLFKCSYWLIDVSIFFGDQNIISKSEVHVSFFKSLTYLLFNCDKVICAYAFLFLALLLGLNGLFFKFLPRLSAFVIWFLVCNINNAVYPSLTAGDFLFQQLLFFNIFLSGCIPHQSNQKGIVSSARMDLDKALHNFGVIAIKIQICLVYFISGLSKLLDYDWIHGKAIAQIFRIEDFGIPYLYENAWKHPGIAKLLDSVVIIYQLAFAVLLSYKNIKKWYLVFGIVQHLYIAFVMGLPTFGFIMIIAYSIFYIPVKKSILSVESV